MDIIIKVADLMKKAQELSDDNMPEVIVSFDEGDDDLPPALCFHAPDPEGLFGPIDYDEIEGRLI